MDKYVISEEEEVYDAEPPFPESMKSDVKVMELHKNTKFGNIIDYVNKLFEDETIRRVIFRGVGDAADKCVSCVEVYKRKRQEELYQWTALSTAKRVTYWDPLVKGMNSMQQSSNNQKKIPPKSGPSSSAKRGGTRKQQQQQRGGRTNKWARPAKAAKDTQAQENREILEKLEKLP